MCFDSRSARFKQSGRGNGGKGLGKEGAKRHCKVFRDSIQGIKPATAWFSRSARRRRSESKT
ncbi:putative histone H4, histone-fold protein [Rosa chinensis]|uniref:Putative histone H4, histone-fold protein n=1 Tax=Rosa chinensis TaxID=74649 RepID=A0A2P6PTW8_ROSCH|nr:putative histone H4, histone-fold protein [Rosa chinensis]